MCNMQPATSMPEIYLGSVQEVEASFVSDRGWPPEPTRIGLWLVGVCSASIPPSWSSVDQETWESRTWEERAARLWYQSLDMMRENGNHEAADWFDRPTGWLRWRKLFRSHVAMIVWIGHHCAISDLSKPVEQGTDWASEDCGPDRYELLGIE